MRLGFIGTGTLSAAVIAGLEAADPGRHAILVSPRSEATSRALATAYPTVARAEDNQAVIDGSDLVLLGVRPGQLDEVVASLAFRPDQTVVSFLAGTAHARVAAGVAPARLCRVIPLPSIRHRRGPVLLFPADPTVESLFAGLGDLVVVETEDDLVACGNASALMSSHFAMQNAMAAWLGSRGVAPASAAFYVSSLFDGLAEVALSAQRDGEPLVPEHHETKGGLNERGRHYLEAAGCFDKVAGALDAIEAHKP